MSSNSFDLVSDISIVLLHYVIDLYLMQAVGFNDWRVFQYKVISLIKPRVLDIEWCPLSLKTKVSKSRFSQLPQSKLELAKINPFFMSKIEFPSKKS